LYNTAALGGGIQNLNATLNMTNTIIAGSMGGGGDCLNIGGTIGTRGLNRRIR
jgi:hypothetical protein